MSDIGARPVTRWVRFAATACLAISCGDDAATSADAAADAGGNAGGFGGAGGAMDASVSGGGVTGPGRGGVGGASNPGTGARGGGVFVPPDAGPPLAMPCGDATSCDDGVFCNGVETCQSGFCVSVGSPCNAATETCSESQGACCVIESTRACNADGDVVWVDSCGTEGATVVEDCADTKGTCSGGACGCTEGWVGDACDRCLLHVDGSAGSDASSGRAWSSALATLGEALSRAAVDECEIWVAAGTYRPTGDATNRTATFALRPGVSVYGGFAGTESARTGRDIGANPTILSGDIDGDGVLNSGNVLHVVTGADRAVLDGFTVTGGNSEAKGGGAGDMGGGMLNRGASPTVARCTFIDNQAFNGGGMANDAGASPVLVSVSFVGNSASDQGGGLYNADGASPVVMNAVFLSNTASGGAGMASADASGIVTNATFADNSAQVRGGGFDVLGTGSLVVRNSILWSNTAPYAPQAHGVAILSYTDVDKGCASIPSADCSGRGNLDADPLFADVAGGDLTLLAGSPALNAGASRSLPSDVADLDGDGDVMELLPLDRAGSVRVDGRVVDLGAYESSDNDGDGVTNASDNCIGAANPAQSDQDGDGDGDACDGSPCEGITCARNCTALMTAGAAEDGVYAIDPTGGSPLLAYCDMTTDGGGWTLVLNYAHARGTNPDLAPSASKLPVLMASTTLGENQVGTEYWGHAASALMAQLQVRDVRFWGVTSGHARIIHFTTPRCTAYFTTGLHECGWVAGRYTELGGHSANLPGNLGGRYADRGDLAMTDLPFWKSGQSHWGVRGEGTRWEVDDYANGSSSDTWHQIWVRSDDQDGTPEAQDSCPGVPNVGQIDQDADGQGDACDATPCPAGGCLPTCSALLAAGQTESGVYAIDPTGTSPILAECDMTTDGGGWTLVLNYVHSRITNPPLDVRADTLPLLLPSTELGDAQPGTAYWGHAAPSLLAELAVSEVRFWGQTSNHAREMHFRTDACNAYFTTGKGSCNGIATSFSAMAGHTANLPASATNFGTNHDDLAMTQEPFYVAGVAHWAVGLGGQRWEVDDYLAANGGDRDTWHQIWVRTLPGADAGP